MMRGALTGLVSLAATAALQAAATPAGAGAQGALSQLGFGYPAGGVSARSLATGGALADADPLSAVNPAAIVLNARARGYIQFEPEFRTVQVGAVSTPTTTFRFPLFMVTGQQSKATFALSYASFMDRTWSNSYPDTQAIGGERIPSTVLTSSEGGIADIRGAVAWSFNERIHVGIAAHLFPGQDRVVAGRIFPDSLQAGGFQNTNTYTFEGAGASLGAVWITPSHVTLAADLRAGGSLSMRLGDSVRVGSGRVPLRYGASVLYDGVPGAVFAVRYSRERWTDLRGLGSSSLGIADATDFSAGAEAAGPRLGPSTVTFRLGYRARGLPFTYLGDRVGETMAGGGIGVPLGGTRAFLDLGLARVARRAADVRERAWIMSLGVGIKP
ncbi:MAG: hypothetical protein IT356_04845 [Gemmatimonadaceae bacterium]|nr:hypothetical protein [Gemmatimonadaceae bacterium]